MKRLLFFKHWQLFLLIVICGAWTSSSPWEEIVNGVFVVTFTLWIYAIGIYGQDRIAEMGLKPMKSSLFKINVGCCCVLSIAAPIYSSIQDEARMVSNSFEAQDIIYTIAMLYGLFAAIQMIIFASKTITKIEFQREVSVNDYFSNILLMVFIFVGIWILQPKVNRLIAQKYSEVA
jgi:hypothetical protein